MAFTYRAITANCGDSDFGSEVTTQLCQLFRDSNCDFYIINLQEARYDEIYRELTAMLRETTYVAQLTSYMTTMTKPSFGHSGIANIIIYNSTTVQIDPNENVYSHCRRNLSEGFNKGGTSASITLKKVNNSEEKLQLLCLSGHLDSNRPDKRVEDWKNLLKLATPKADSNQDLIRKCPDLIVSGVDCNTRNLLTQQNTKIWLTEHEEVQGFNQFPIGNLRYSHENTYTPPNEVRKEKERKYSQQGYTLSGSLDINEILNCSDLSLNVFDAESSTPILPIKGHSRDHTIIVTPQLECQALDEFEHLRNYICFKANNVAPDLTSEIFLLEDNPENRELLFQIHNAFFKDNGIMEQLLGIYQEKLAYYREIKSSNRNPIVIKNIHQELFHNTPWLNSFYLANFDYSTIIDELKVAIDTDRDTFQHPMIYKTLEELRKECITILSKYADIKSGIFSVSFNRNSIFKKSFALNETISKINTSSSKEEIIGAIDGLKQQSDIVSQTGTGKFAQCISTCEHIIQKSTILTFEDPVPDLKKYIIQKLDHYQITPKDSSIKNAATINQKNNFCNHLINTIDQSKSIEEMYLIFNGMQENYKTTLLAGTGKFSSAFNECMEVIKAVYIQHNPDSRPASAMK